jgi:CHASE3 domain sensor protein
MADAKQAWDQVGDSFTALGRLLKDRFDRDDQGPETEAVEDALKSLGDAARRLGDTVSEVVRDPEFQQTAQRVALSLGTALTATFSQVSRELEDAFRPRRDAGEDDGSQEPPPPEAP